MHLILLKIIMTLYIRNTEKLIIKFAHEQKFWLNYWVKNVDSKLKKISLISVLHVRKYFQEENLKPIMLNQQILLIQINGISFYYVINVVNIVKELR